MHPRRIAWLFGCSQSELPTRAQLADYKRKAERPRHVRGTPRAALPGVLVPRSELQRAHAACKASGTTLSAELRALVRQLGKE